MAKIGSHYMIQPGKLPSQGALGSTMPSLVESKYSSELALAVV